MLRNFVSTADATQLLAESDSLAVLRFAGNSAAPDTLIPTRVEHLPDVADALEVFKVDNEMVIKSPVILPVRQYSTLTLLISCWLVR